MKDTINKLRAEAIGNIKGGESTTDTDWAKLTGVLISNQEAIDIANALEHLTAPPLVLAAINILQLASESERFPEYEWAAIDRDGLLCLYKSRPRLGRVGNGYWVASEGSYDISPGDIPVFDKIDHKQMLFFRNENGWEWVGDRQDTKEQQ